MNFTDNVTLDFFHLNQRFRVIFDFKFWIADLLYRFALSFFIKLMRRRWTLNPNSKIQNPKSMLIQSVFELVSVPLHLGST